MAPEGTVDGRARAWVLVKAERAQELAEGLYDELGHEGGDSFVVIRADIVDFDYNVMIPVDAESWEVVDEVVGIIKDRRGVTDTVVVPVQGHVPYPPQDANGYITEEEAEAGKETVEPGRQGASPGYNGWG
jgi:hypothetical protein